MILESCCLLFVIFFGTLRSDSTADSPHSANSGSGIATLASWQASAVVAGTEFGSWVSDAGDVNGDGYADVLVGERDFSTDDVSLGRVMVYFGSISGLSDSPALTVVGSTAHEGLGFAHAGVGDIDNDGFSDFAIGAPSFSAQFNAQGRVVVFHGGSTPIEAWNHLGQSAGETFGASVAAAGDVNNDGFADLIVGSPGFSGDQGWEGRASVFLGSSIGLSDTPIWTAEGNLTMSNFGHSVASVGDLNGDSFCDVAIGTSQLQGSAEIGGRVSCFLGTTSGVESSPFWVGVGSHAQGNYGASLACAGDVELSGTCGIVIGVPNADNGMANEGGIIVVSGGTTPHEMVPVWSVLGTQSQARLGENVARGIDMNSDGFLDILAGAPYYDFSSVDSGQAVVFLGNSSGLPSEPSWHISGTGQASRLGTSNSVTNDSDGDGLPEILVGEPGSGVAKLFPVTPPSFFPGDRLIGNLESYDDRTSALYSGLDGMKLKLNFDPVDVPMKLRIQVLDANNLLVDSATAKLGNKNASILLKHSSSGEFKLRIFAIGGLPGSFEVGTKRLLPPASISSSKILKPTSGSLIATARPLAFDGSLLSAVVKKKEFTGTLQLSMINPIGELVDFEPFASLSETGDISIIGLPLTHTGQHELRVHGFATKKEKVKLVLYLLHPDSCGSVVSLP